MADPSIVSAARKYLNALREAGFDVRFGVLFGSHASGKTHEWSDIDLLVVSREFDGKRDRRHIDRLWYIAAVTDSRIEPIPCGEKQWEEDAVSTIIEIARREGEHIHLTDDSPVPVP